MRAQFSPEQESFREEVKAFLEPHRGLDGFMRQGQNWPGVRAMFSAMGERGWLALTWPTEYGGLGKGLAEEYILWDEVAYARCARNPLSSGIVAKTLIRHGSGEQKERWLPDIRAGRSHFSIAYSEPQAGSDLASLRCKAELQGERYVVNGQKCWQSYAQDMDHLWLLCRTGSQESRGRGLTLLIVDRNSPGVTVRPLPTMDGEQLNEIFFDNVEVPVSQRVGPQDGAWKIMSAALADERHIQFPPRRIRADFEEVVALLRDCGALHQERVRERLAELAVRVHEVEAHGLRVLDAMQRGQAGVAEAAANKIAHTLACQEIARAALDLAGPQALRAEGRAGLLWAVSKYETIGGGTSEIMRGIVASHDLELHARG